MNLSDRDRDLAIRTIIGEAGDQPDVGQQAVGSVILNRAASGRYGKTVSDVVLQPYAFEPWLKRSKELMAIDPSSKEYTRAAAALDAATTSDPTNGSTHFLDPALQTRLGRKIPGWASGPSVVVGSHAFYSPEGRVNRVASNDDDAFLQQWGIADKKPAGNGSAPAAMSDDDFLGKWGIGKPATAAGPARKDFSIADPYTGPGLPGQVVGGTMGFKRRFKPDETPPDSALNQVRAALGGVVGSFPIIGPAAKDLAQKGAARLNAFTQGTSYEDELAEIQAKAAEVEARNPLLTRGGQVVGAVIGTAPALIAAPEAFGIGAGSLLTRSAASMATGGLIGGADAAARGEDPALGAATGAAFGTVAPGAGELIGWGANKILSAPGQIRPAAAAGNELLRASGEGGRRTPDFAAEFAANPRLAPVDVDSNLLLRGQGIAAQPGPGRAVIDYAVKARQAAAPAATTAAYDAAAGAAPDVAATLEAYKQTAKANANRGFTAALQNAKPVDVSPVLKHIDDIVNPGVAPGGASSLPPGPAEQALMRVRNMLANDRETLTDASKLHRIQSGIREQAETLLNSSSGQDRIVGKSLMDVRGEMNSAIDKATGGKFSAAQAKYKDDMAVEGAFNKGLSVFSNRSGVAGLEDRPEYWSRWVKQASPEELKAVRLGVRTAVDHDLNAVRNAVRKGESLPEVGFNRDKLEAILGKPETDRLAREMADSRRMGDTNNKLLGGSQTAARTEAVKATEVKSKAPPINDLMKTTLTGLAVGLPLKGIESASRGLTGSFGQARNRAMAEALMDPNRFLTMTTKAAASRSRRAALGQVAGNTGNLLLRSDGPIETRNRLLSR